MGKKVFIKTFGCQMNEYDSDKMVDVLRAVDQLLLHPNAQRQPSVSVSTPPKSCPPTMPSVVPNPTRASVS